MIIYKLQKASVDILMEYEKVLIDKIGDKGGVYILHKGNKIYYVGKAVRLKRRIKQHFTDHHKDHWNAFSVYVVSNNKFIPELERLLISLLKPSGNSLLYEREVKKSENELKREIRDLQNEYLNDLFPKADKSQKRRKKKSIRYFKRLYNGKKYCAMLLRDGSVKLNGRKYNSLSAAAKAVTKQKSISGPSFWGVK